MSTETEVQDYKLVLSQMSKSLTELDHCVIGLAKINGYVELVLETTEYTFITYTVGKLLGSTTSHYPIEKYGHCIVLFPNGKNFFDMKKDPFGLQEFMNKYKL